MSSCGEKLVGLLENYGVDTVFGIPGNHTVQLYRGLSASSIRHVTPRHEQGAGFMADGYARASGKPGVCFLISGPGLTNAATAMMQALADSIPMLVITAVAARKDLGMGEGRLHELPDQSALAAQCARFSHTLMRPEELPRVLARAFAVFDSERPGPVHIELPLDVITADASAVSDQPWPRSLPAVANPAAIEQAADILSSAARPLLLAGGGAIGGAEELRELAERLDAPVLNTVNAKGVLPAGHSLAVGGSPSLPCLRQALNDADVVLAVGTELGETDYDMLFVGELEIEARLLRIDIDARQLSRNQAAEVAMVGDASASLAALLEKLKSGESGRGAESGAERCLALRDKVCDEEHFHQDFQDLFNTIRESAEDLRLVGDSTLPTYYAVWQYEAAAPRRYFHSATGGGTLGYALPAAIGASLAQPGLPVAALIGDGSIQFTLAELASAAELGLSLPVLVWNNEGYGEIKRGMLAAKVEPTGVDIFTPDLCGAARALGCAAQRVTTLEELGEALQAAFAAGKPSLIELQQQDFLTAPAGAWY